MTRIEQLMQTQAVTAEELAQCLCARGETPTERQISGVEKMTSGKMWTPKEARLKIAAYLGVPISEIFDRYGLAERGCY